MQHEKPVALVTGANRGIGLQIAKELVAHGFTVLLGSRDTERGRAAAASIGPDARALVLDVTSEASVVAAAKVIEAELGRLDVLVNNAGIAQAEAASDRSLKGIVESGRPSTASLSEVRAVFETNVFGVIAVTQAMLPLLRRSPAGRIVNVSSGAGSITRISAPSYKPLRVGGVAYGPSKSALNAVTVAFAHELEDTPIKVNAVCPGYTATDFNYQTGPRTVAQGAREPVRLALLGPDGPTGTFWNDEGPLPW